MSSLFRMFGVLLLAPVLALAASPVAVEPQSAPHNVQPDHAQLVILVRHAEKALDQGSDPALTDVGVARAQSLVAVLAHAGVGAVITTQWQRTRATAAPLAAKLAITPVVVSTEGAATDAHPQAVAAAIRAQSADVVLVVGHSNTLPAIIAALGGPRIADLGDNDYGNLYTLWRDGDQVRLIESKY